MPSAEEAAAAVAAKMIAGSDEAPEGESSEDAAATESQDAVLPDLEVELPEDLIRELDEPEFVEEETPDEDEPDFEDYGEGDADPAVLKRLRQAEKKAEYYENLRAEDSKRKWKDEAKKFFPLSEYALDDIQATSRRGYLKQAQAAHQSVLPHLKPYIEQMQTTLESEKEKARAEAREEAEKAWGRPATGDNAASDAEAHREQVEKARRRPGGELSDVIRAMMFPKKS